MRNILQSVNYAFKVVFRLHFILWLTFILMQNQAESQVNPLIACSVGGQTPVTQLDTWTYTLAGSCSATSWTVTCGSIQSYTSTSVTVYFNMTGCSSSVITAKNGATTLASKTVTVNALPLTGGTISNPTQTINYNTAPALLTATSPTGGSCGSYSYQWYSSPNNSTYSSISGATSASYQPPAITSTTYYKRQTICGSSDAYTTNVATITVYPQLIPGNVYLNGHPGVNNETIISGHNSGLMVLTGVSGGSGTYTYQWQSSPDNVHWTTISGATGTSYTSPGLTATTYYNVAVNSNGVLLNSNSFEVIVNPVVIPGVLTPSLLAIASGTNPGQLNSSAASGGGCGGSFQYQWQVSTDGTSFSTISGATSLSYTPAGTLSANTWYWRQVICSVDTEYTNACQVNIIAASANLNYIRERDIQKAGVTDTVTADGLSSPYDVAQVTQYFDGLGRLVQSVAKDESPLQHDEVSTVVYDNFGRQPVQYMPYSATTSDGNYKPTAIADGLSFNASMFSGEQYYMSQVNYEASPLNRTLNTYSPGANWIGSERGTSEQYMINTASDSVQIWSISSAQLSIPVNNGAYAAGQLYKTMASDEQGHQVVEYKDKLGKTILKKVQQSSSPSTGHYGWICTYYVYDTLQNLRFIIQPQAVATINGSWSISTTIANELCYRYEYDGRRRLAIKKVPGAGQVWYVDDARDRIAMMQDSLMRASQKWIFIKYDSENRPDSIGLITDPSHYSNLAYHDTLAYHSTSYPAVSSYTNELLGLKFYDDYSWVSAYSAPVSSTMATNYTSNSSYFITSYNTSPNYAVAVTPMYITRGMPTGSMRKVIGTVNQYLYSVDFYDDRGRTIQSQSVNYTGAIDTATVQYNFKGAVLRTLLNHKKGGNTVQNHIVLTKMDYDHAFRLRHIYKNIDNAAADQVIDSIQYNELGQVREKYLGNLVDSMVYDYNIRGWLTGINKSYVAGTTNHYFGMELGYDKTTSSAPGNTYTTPEYNGNIEGAVWKTAGSAVNRKYDYTYDNVNRLTAANFTQYNGSGFDLSAGINFTTSNLSYDANGNILTMRQYGFMVGGSNPIDELKYTYQSNSNKLNQVYDTANNPTSLLGDFHYAGTKGSFDYAYDGNGNQVIDSNKSISLIHYNFLNLPDSIVFSGKGYIKYVYDAGGTKLQKITVDNVANKGTFTTYVAGFVYQRTTTPPTGGGGTDTLQFVRQEEGRVRWAWHKYTTGATAYKYEYDFFERDNLGNTRVVLTQEHDTTNYLASMETVYRTTEAQLFSNITNTCYPWASVPGSSGIPSGQKLAITNPNDSVAKVDFNGTSGYKTGPGLLLKVMSGDTVSMAVQSYYNTNSITTTNSSFNDVLNSFAAGIVATPTGAAKGTLANYIAGSSPVYLAVSSFLSSKDPSPPSGYPKAYLNWILLDDQFNYVSGSSGSVAAASGTYPAATLNTVAPGAPLTIPKNGYLYVWVSNETQGWDVFFDNLSVQHKQGPLLEENHYYPFGLGMEGLSDKAIKTNYAENKYRYNSGSELQNKEFSDGTGWEMYETQYRGFDPQIGRFGQIDPLADESNFSSTYQFASNNPISMNDPTGMFVHYQSAPSSTVTNTAPGFGSPSIEEINSITGYDSDQGADAGEENDNADNSGSGSGSNNASDDNSGFTITETDSYYDYHEVNGDGTFITPNNDGMKTYQPEEYYFTGMSTVTTTTFYGDGDNQESNATEYEGGSNGWETAGEINETANFSFETTMEMVQGAQKLGNSFGGTSSEIITGGEFAEGASKGFALFGAGLTVADGLENGWKPHHTADLVVDATIYTFSAAVPVAGWILGGVWFVGDMITEQITGKSITENVFDD